MSAPVIWLTGIPASGKTTLALELQKFYQQKKPTFRNFGRR